MHPNKFTLSLGKVLCYIVLNIKIKNWLNF